MSTLETVPDDTSDLDGPAPRGIIPFGPPAPKPPPTPPAPRPAPRQPVSPLPIPEDALYGWLGEHCRTLDAPRNWAYPALLTVFASMRIFTNSRIRPTLYTILTGPPEDGKSVTQDRAVESLGLLGTRNIHTATPSSDRGLQLLLAPPKPEEDKTGAPVVKELLSSTIVIDEFRQLLSKVGIHGSSLAPTLCQLWSKDQAASPVKNGMMEIYARMSLLGALACQDRDEFAEMFGAETMGGLYSRMIICPGPSGWKWSARWPPQVVLRRPATRPISVPDSVYDTVDAWRDSDPDKKRGRICEIALRVALISAAANHDTEITPECIQAALRFGEWQERVKSVYCASYAQNDDAKITVAVLDAIAEAEGELADGESRWVHFSSLIRAKNWGRKFGSSHVTRVKRSLIEDRLLEAEPELGDDGKIIPGKFTGRVRSC